MLRLPFNTNFRLFFFLFFAPAITITAQETHLYKQLLKESLKPDFMRPDATLELDSSVNNTKLFNDSIFNDTISNDAKDEYIRRMLFYYRIEFLLPEKDRIHFEDKTPKLSPGATQFYYTNPKNESWDNGKFNGGRGFSGEFATKKDVLEAKAVRGIISESISIPKKESKRAKTLRIIKEDVYHIED